MGVSRLKSINKWQCRSKVESAILNDGWLGGHWNPPAWYSMFSLWVTGANGSSEGRIKWAITCSFHFLILPVPPIPPAPPPPLGGILGGLYSLTRGGGSLDQHIYVSVGRFHKTFPNNVIGEGVWHIMDTAEFCPSLHQSVSNKLIHHINQDFW